MDSLQQAQQEYEIEVRSRAAQYIRELGLPLFDAMDKAQRDIATERQRKSRFARIARLAGMAAGSA
jgi:hypothetical protein